MAYVIPSLQQNLRYLQGFIGDPNEPAGPPQPESGFASATGDAKRDAFPTTGGGGSFLSGSQPSRSAGIGGATSSALSQETPEDEQSAPLGSLQGIQPGLPPSAPGGALRSPIGGGPADLLGGLTRGVQEQQEAIGELGQAFRGKAGPVGVRTYEGIGAQNTLDSAIAPSSTTDSRGAAKGLIGSTYGGPTELDAAEMARIQGETGELESRANALRSGTGIQATLQETVPGLTPGQAEFEAAKYRYDPKFQGQAIQEGQNIAHLNRILTGERTQATDIASQRAAEEKQIAERSRGYVTEKRQGIMDDLLREMADEQARNDALQGISDTLQAGSGQDLGLIPEEYRNEFNTPGRQQAGEARKIYDDIQADYLRDNPWLKDFPDPLVPRVTGRGRTWWGYRDPKTGKVIDIRKIPGLSKEQERVLTARQNQYDKVFGTDLGWGLNQKKSLTDEQQTRLDTDEGIRIPKDQPQIGENRNRKPVTRADLEQESGRLQDIAPIYFRDDAQAPQLDENGEPLLPSEEAAYQSFEDSLYKPDDYRTFFNFKPSAGLSVGNLANDAQVSTFNNIQDILNEAERLAADNLPYTAAKIMAEPERFLAEEQKALEARGVALDAAGKAFLQKVKNTRKQHRQKVKNNTGWSAAAKIVLNVATGGQAAALGFEDAALVIPRPNSKA